MRNALSEGLYHMEKYMMHDGTTAASGMPRKKRAVNKPAGLLTPTTESTIAPQMTIMIGKKTFAENFFMRMLLGSNPIVTAK
jgi:hypothetical protein